MGCSWSTPCAGTLEAGSDQMVYFDSPGLSLNYIGQGGYGWSGGSTVFATGTTVSMFCFYEPKDGDVQYVYAHHINVLTDDYDEVYKFGRIKVEFVFMHANYTDWEWFRVTVFLTIPNDPPILTGITQEPPGPDYIVGDTVRVTASFIDPDGDSFVLEYFPSQTVTLHEGANLIYIDARDCRHGFTEVVDTINARCVSRRTRN